MPVNLVLEKEGCALAANLHGRALGRALKQKRLNGNGAVVLAVRNLNPPVRVEKHHTGDAKVHRQRNFRAERHAHRSRRPNAMSMFPDVHSTIEDYYAGR